MSYYDVFNDNEMPAGTFFISNVYEAAAESNINRCVDNPAFYFVGSSTKTFSQLG